MGFENCLNAGRKLARALASYKERHPVIWRCRAGAYP